MEHVLHAPTRRMLVVPLVAAVLSAGVATTAVALIDSGHESQSKVVITLPSGVH